MVCEDVRILEIDDRALMRGGEEVVRVAHQVLIDGIIVRDQRRHRLLHSPARSACLLPRASDAAGIARQDCRVEPADVNADLERRRGRDPDQLTTEEQPFDLPPFRGSITGSIGHYLVGIRRLVDP